MSLYKHMQQLAAARDDESRPLAERITAAEVLKTTCRIAYERATKKAQELSDKQLEKQNATQQSVDTINVLMERFADTLRCYPEPKQ
jgi:hypothetical protein